MEENIEKIKSKRDAFDMIFDLLAQTGEPRFVYQKKNSKFQNKLSDLSIDNDITDEQFKKLSNLIDQFDKMTDDFLKLLKEE